LPPCLNVERQRFSRFQVVSREHVLFESSDLMVRPAGRSRRPAQLWRDGTWEPAGVRCSTSNAPPQGAAGRALPQRGMEAMQCQLRPSCRSSRHYYVLHSLLRETVWGHHPAHHRDLPSRRACRCSTAIGVEPASHHGAPAYAVEPQLSVAPATSIEENREPIEVGGTDEES
jgi:hypothetical protein